MYDFKRFQMNATIDLEGKTQLKKDEVLDIELTINDFSFARTCNGETSVILFKEKPDKFLFGGKVITNLLKDINDDPEAVKASIACENTRARRERQNACHCPPNHHNGDARRA